MEKNIKKQNVYISEDEKTLNWSDIQASLKKILEVKYITAGYKKFLL